MPSIAPHFKLTFAILAGCLFLGVATVYGWYFVFSRPMSPDEGYLMITVQGFGEGNSLYDSVFTHYGPFYYAYEWLLHTLFFIPLTHDATRLLCVFHWLSAAALLGLSGGLITRSVFGGLFVFAQAVIHLSALASEPGHPQELIAILVALSIFIAARGFQRRTVFQILAGVSALLLFTKINVGVFFGFAVFLTLLCAETIPSRPQLWGWLLTGACAGLPFFVMRPHLSSEWCRNYALVTACGITAALLVASRVPSHRNICFAGYISLPLFFLLPAALLVAMTLLTGTSLRGLAEGLLLTPLKMPGVAVLPLPLGNAAVLNAAASLLLAIGFTVMNPKEGSGRGVIALQTAFGVAGAACLLGNAKAQISFMLPWVWLVLLPATRWSGSAPLDLLPRLWLSLASTWQSLQAYPIAGTQISTGTMLLVLAYTICLYDAWRAFIAELPQLEQRIKKAIGACQPQTAIAFPALAVSALLWIFANGWCNLSVVRRDYANLPPLQLPGSTYVHMDAEITDMYRALTEYLGKECDTFVTYPGVNSLYFWTGKRPPTHLNSTGWGSLTQRQQEQILAALRKAPRSRLLVVAAEFERWLNYIPPPISPLVHCVFDDCQEVGRIGRFIIFVPKSPVPPPQTSPSAQEE